MGEEWRLVDLGPLNGFQVQSVYEAIAEFVGGRSVPNTVVLCYPASPYVCVGVHQEVWREVDVEYCTKHRIPIVRRKQGGGVVYLDSGQQFYHIITKSEGQMDVEAFYRRHLAATVHTYSSYGLPAEYRPVNDVVIGGRKASGNAASTIHGANVLIGNVILELDVDTMSRTLRVPSAKFRDKLAKGMEDWLTSLRRELGFPPNREEIKERLIEGYEKTLGIDLTGGDLTQEERNLWRQLIQEYEREEWTYSRMKEHQDLSEIVTGRSVKISADVHVCESTYKAEKLLRITLLTRGDKIMEAMISGDFFLEPHQTLGDLEKELIGSRVDEGELSGRIGDFFRRSGATLVGASPEDLVRALLGAKRRPHLA